MGKVANKKAPKKVAARKAVRAAAALTSEGFRQAARTGEAWMAAVLTAENEIKVSGTNAVQALGQGQLPFKYNGERVTTGQDQLKGNFAAFDGKAAAFTTAAITASDYPLDGIFTRTGMVRLHILATHKLCGNPSDQKMVEAIYAAIVARYPEASKAEPAAVRTRNRAERIIKNPNPLFA